MRSRIEWRGREATASVVATAPVEHVPLQPSAQAPASPAPSPLVSIPADQPLVTAPHAVRTSSSPWGVKPSRPPHAPAVDGGASTGRSRVVELGDHDAPIIE